MHRTDSNIARPEPIAHETGDTGDWQGYWPRCCGRGWGSAADKADGTRRPSAQRRRDASGAGYMSCYVMVRLRMRLWPLLELLLGVSLS